MWYHFVTFRHTISSIHCVCSCTPATGVYGLFAAAALRPILCGLFAAFCLKILQSKRFGKALSVAKKILMQTCQIMSEITWQTNENSDQLSPDTYPNSVATVNEYLNFSFLKILISNFIIFTKKNFTKRQKKQKEKKKVKESSKSGKISELNQFVPWPKHFYTPISCWQQRYHL